MLERKWSKFDTVTKQVMMQAGRMTAEGDDLYYEVRGKGQPLVLIPGAGGDADRYTSVTDILSDEYKVITYDRRATSRSTMNDPYYLPDIETIKKNGVRRFMAGGKMSLDKKM